MCLKIRQEKLYKVFMHNILYTSKAVLSKNCFHFFFFSFSDMEKFHHLFGYHATGINSSLIYF